LREITGLVPFGPTEFVVLDAPFNLGLRPPKTGVEPGVRFLARALRERDLVQRLNARDLGVVPALAYELEPDPETGIWNGPKIRRYAIALANRVELELRAGRFPVVLGGDCSILIGNGLAAKRVGRHGLLFLDGHDDFSAAVGVTMRGAAGQDLAVVTGNGPSGLSDIEGLSPYFAEQDVVAFGFQQNEPEGEYDRSGFNATAIKKIGASTIEKDGLEYSVIEALDHFDQRGVDRIWIHLDADVIRSAEMPAVDSPEPNGLSMAELTTVLRMFMKSALPVGIEITIFDPELDPSGDVATRFASCILEGIQL
jgi:arginase